MLLPDVAALSLFLTTVSCKIVLLLRVLMVNTCLFNVFIKQQFKNIL